MEKEKPGLVREKQTKERERKIPYMMFFLNLIYIYVYCYTSLERISRDQVSLCLRVNMPYSQYRKYYRK